MNQELKIHFPGKLVFGEGSPGNLADEIRLLSPEKVLIVTIGPLLGQLKNRCNENHPFTEK